MSNLIKLFLLLLVVSINSGLIFAIGPLDGKVDAWDPELLKLIWIFQQMMLAI